MIVPVKRVKIFTLEEHKNELLTSLQNNQLMMLSDKLDTASIDSKYEDGIILRGEQVLKRLSEYQKKKSFFEYNEVTYTDFVFDDIKRNDLLEDLESNIALVDSLKESNVQLLKKKENLEPFARLPYVINDLTKSLYVSFYLGYVPEKQYESLITYFTEEKIEHEVYGLSKVGYPIIFVLDKDEQESQLLTINGLSFTESKLPLLRVKVSDEIETVNKQHEANLLNIQQLEEELSNSKHLEVEIKVLMDQMIAKKERMLVPILKTDETIYIDGWVREDQIEDLRALLETITPSFDLDIKEPLEDDLVPTATKNNKFVHQFETITNMFSVPNHKEIDPNPVMSIWYWLIFGIMMGDVGYGLAMVVVFGLFIKLKRPKGSLSQLVHILFYSGFTSIAAGVVFGSVFGFDVNFIGFVGKIFGQTWNSFSVIDDPLTMLFFSIGLGIAHIVSALVLKVMLSFKQKDILTALPDGFSWIFILLGGSLTVVNMVSIKVKFLTILGLIFVGVGVLFILFLSGRDKKGIFGKITSGLGGLYNSTGYLSDLLSYSRILALSLSSAVIASTMNTLAELVQGNIIGILFSVVIYIIGHSFNFVMGLLSAYVHDSRLQYIEFYNKFYEGGGIEFTPLSFNNQHINEITN